MSNESSASETTPLRRPESQNSTVDDNIITTLTPPMHTSHITNSNNSNNLHINRAASGASGSSSTVAFANHNNNNVEVRLGQDLRAAGGGGDATAAVAREDNYQTTLKMDTTNKRILCRISLDIFILICVGIPILGFYLWGEPFKRGFFCDDESLKHPFRESTIRNWMLYVIGLVIPVGLMLSVEVLKWQQRRNRLDVGHSNVRQYALLGYEVPDWLVECYKKIGVFVFGAAIGQLTTDIAKYSIGRLRPHFFAVCQPVLADGGTCSDPAQIGRYITNFTCKGVGSTERMLKEMRLSFPSGHSSFTFYTMVYVALYLQSRMTWHGSKLLRHFLQFLFIMTAWYTALSRVSDYKHHWSDVLAGSAIGSLCAVIVAKYISDLFPERSSTTYVLPRTAQDLTSTQTAPSNGY